MSAPLPPAPESRESIHSLGAELAAAREELAANSQRMARMEGLFVHVAEPIFVAERDGQIVDANPAACVFFGWSREELLTKFLWDFVNGVSREEILQTLNGLDGGQAQSVQLGCQTQAGEERVMELRLTRNRIGGRDLIIGACRDVTAQLHTKLSLEEALRDAQQVKAQLQLALDTTPGLVWSALPDGQVDFLNQRWQDYTGVPLASAGGRGWEMAIHPEDLPGLSQFWAALLASGKPGEKEIRVRGADLGYRWFLFRAVPLHDDCGRVVKWYGQTMDIHDRKLAESLLSGQNRLLEMIARGEALSSVLEALCRLVEESSPRIVCSILLIDPKDGRLRHGAAPGLPPGYAQIIDGLPLGPDTGPCGRAAFLKAQVVVPEIMSDPHSIRYCSAALATGLRACWSSPVWSSDGRVLGTFAIYSRDPGQPTTDQEELIQQSAHLASIAVERKQAAEALRASEHLARGQRDALSRSLDALVREADPDNLLEHVLRAIVDQTGAHSVSVWDSQEEELGLELVAVVEKGLFHFRQELGHAASRLSNLPPEHPVWNDVFKTGQHVVLLDIDQIFAQAKTGIETGAPWNRVMEDGHDQAGMLLLKQYLRGIGVRSVLFVPMLISGSVAGIIGVQFTGNREFRREEIELTLALAHQATLAIQLRRLSQQSRQSAVLEERNRMARDIHDTLAQGFTGVIVQLEAAADARNHDLIVENENHLRRASELARESLEEARRSVRALRPQVLEEKGLRDALEEQFFKLTVGANIAVRFSVEGNPQSLPQEWDDNLLRIGIEVLTNALRHAHAAHFDAVLRYAAAEVCLEMRDDGDGFDPWVKHDGFGLVCLKERTTSMGGTVSVRSAPGHGTSVLIALPLERNTESYVS